MVDETAAHAPLAGVMQHSLSSCEAFKEALRRGDPPSFVGLLGNLQEPVRSETARNLLETLLTYSRESGNTIDSDDLIRRNSEFEHLIHEMLVSSSPAPTPRRLGDYELRRKLGGGGMGDVWLAIHRLLGKEVAVKLLREANPDQQGLITRFEREMETLAKLEHPHIVSVQDARHVDGEYLLVMEYVEGIDLSRLVKKTGEAECRLAVTDACEMTRQAALGLHYAHECGVVHRDIKPSNLILSRKGVVKIVDFGLARGMEWDHLENQITDSRTLLGTFDYMAPEQFKDPTKVGAPADVYSLGCTLYCLLNGKPPFADVGPSLFDKADAHRDPKKLAPSLSGLRADVDGGLSRIVRTMLAKDPSQRYGNLCEVADALEPWCRGHNLCRLVATYAPSEAPSPDTQVDRKNDRTQPGTPASRRKFLIYSSAAVGAIGIAGLFGWALLRSRLRPEMMTLAVTLGTLPSLRGWWWFDEIPGLLPSIRQSWVHRVLADALDEPVGDDDPLARFPVDELHALAQSDDVGELDVHLRQWCKDFASGDRQMITWVGRLNSASADRAEYQRQLVETLREVETAAREQPSAAMFHLQALLNHKLALNAQVNQRRDFWGMCDTLYSDAQKAYKREAREATTNSMKIASQIMERLCLSDATVRYEDRGQWQDNALILESMLSTASDSDSSTAPSVHERVYCGGRLGEARALRMAFDEAAAAFAEAESRLPALPDNHPLRARFFEFRAWHFVDRGDSTTQAIADFDRANQIRIPAAQTDWPQRVFKFHNMHGIGVAWHWEGRYAEAKQQLGQVVGELADEIARVEQEIQQSKTLKYRQYRVNLIERYVNSNERYADCYLFGDRDFKRAAELYTQGVKFAEDRGLDSSLLLPTTAPLQLRAAIAYRMAEGLDSPPSPQAREVWEQSQARAAQLDPELRGKHHLLTLCAAALQASTPSDADDRRAEVHHYLRDRQKNSSEALSTKLRFPYLNRDDRQLAILLAEHLQLVALAGRK
jgi:tRNA A-37 threonylcarbamoyl transferase component Bud32